MISSRAALSSVRHNYPFIMVIFGTGEEPLLVLPSLTQKPASGTLQMQIVIADFAAIGTCPARKIPSIALIHTPRKDFTGTDPVQIEIDSDNRTTLLSYRIGVVSQAEPL